MLDIIFLVGLAIALFVGYRSGFARALVGFLGIFVSALGGYFLYQPVSSFLMGTPLRDWVHGGAISWTQNYVAQHANDADFIDRYQETAVELLTPQIADGITVVILNIISILLVILIIRLGVNILKKCTKLINRIPVLGKINQWVGMLLTGASFLVACFAIVAVMFSHPANQSELSRDMRQKIDNSIIVKPVMKCNFFADYQNMN